MQDELEVYGNIYRTMIREGDGYYFYGYEESKTFEFDPTLQILFDQAFESTEAFKKHIEEKIKKLGGNPADYES